MHLASLSFPLLDEMGGNVLNEHQGLLPVSGLRGRHDPEPLICL